jgi:CDGSH-type Zn-finger protein
MRSKKESAHASSKNVAKIKVSKNGPYLIYGGIPIQKQIIIADSEETAIEWQLGSKYPLQEKCALCRCGHAMNKPFCDGSHIKVGFDGTETAREEVYLNQPKAN